MYALLLKKVDQLNVTVLPEITLESFFSESLVVLHIANVYVSRCTRVNSKRKRRRQGTRIFTPTNLQPTIVQGKTLIRCNLEESKCSSGIDKGNKL